MGCVFAIRLVMGGTYADVELVKARSTDSTSTSLEQRRQGMATGLHGMSSISVFFRLVR